jgi:hypothetical protein
MPSKYLTDEEKLRAARALLRGFQGSGTFRGDGSCGSATRNRRDGQTRGPTRAMPNLAHQPRPARPGKTYSRSHVHTAKEIHDD